MAYNGSGSFTVNGSYFPAVAGALIESAKYNGALNDIATGLSTAITKDGQTAIAANLPMTGYRHTGVGDGVARTDYASVGQLQDSGGLWAGTAGGTANAITLTLSPAITAYAAGQSFQYKSGAAANTTAMTVAVSGLITKAIQNNGSAVASGDHPANMWFRITYDGAAFQLEQIATTSATTTASINAVIPSGTVMPFFQAAAPTGWTQVVTHNNKALRIVSGTGGGSGGSVAFTTAFASQAVAGSNSATTLTSAQIPAHTHDFNIYATSGAGSVPSAGTATGGSILNTTGIGSGGGGSHNHTFTGTAINLAVQYIDMIIASKN